MSRESRMLAGVLLIVIPTVMYGGLSLLYFLTRARRVTQAIRCGTIFGEPEKRYDEIRSPPEWWTTYFSSKVFVDRLIP